MKLHFKVINLLVINLLFVSCATSTLITKSQNVTATTKFNTRTPAQSQQDLLGIICKRIAAKYTLSTAYNECIAKYQNDSFDQIGLSTCATLPLQHDSFQSSIQLSNCVDMIRNKRLPYIESERCYEKASTATPDNVILCLKKIAN